MNLKTQYTEIIDRYLDGELSGEELASFRKQLLTNDDLRRELKLQQEINNALGETEIVGLRNQLKEIHKGQHSGRKEISLPRRIMASRISQLAAASILILLSLTVFTNIFKSELTANEKLFSQYYDKYEPLNVRASSSPADEIYLNAVNAYNKEDYEQALVLFEEVLDSDQNRMEANIMSGVSNMELSKYKNASGSFEKVIDHNNNLFIEDAQWYLGFCYLKTDHTEKAIEQFTKIASSTSSRKDKAKKILRKIN